MLRTKRGNFYTPKEILEIICNYENYPPGEYLLKQTVFGGLFVCTRNQDQEEKNDLYTSSSQAGQDELPGDYATVQNGNSPVQER